MIIEALCNVHSHLREGPVMIGLLEKALEGGADVILPMPNTQEGLTSCEKVLEYIEILKRCLVSFGRSATFLPTLMINEETPLDEIDWCVETGICNGRVYPRYRTTKSHNGVRHYGRLLPKIEHCGKVGMKAHFHPEHPWMIFGNRDAEFAFLPIVDMLLNETEACIIWEHGTDGRCIPFWKEMATSGRFYVTLTAHHLATDEDATFGDVRAICKPLIKTRADQESLIQLVKEDNDWVMAGADDAPHDVSTKHVPEGNCACGAYTAPFALQLYAHTLGHLFHTDKGVKTFINFTSRNGRRLHGLTPTSRRFDLVRKPFQIPASYSIGDWQVEPFWANRQLVSSLEEIDQN